jgi:hypothetical protein
LLNVSSYTGAMKVTFQWDAPWAWSDIKKKSYICNSTLNLGLNLDIDFDQYLIQPTLQIKALANGIINIKNTTTNETIEFTGCVANEEIILECDSDKIVSSQGNIISRWNKNTISLKQGINNIVLTGNFSMTMSYRLPIRVGA